MKYPQVSILVPIYNVSPFIERCAHSLFNQTFQDIEYVFVNDCTPDNSMEMLAKVIEQYPLRKEQVKIIQHTNNKGIGATRNTLLDNACRQYFLFIDSDDWIEPDMIELLYNKAEETKADVTVCDFFEELKNKNVIVTDVVFDDIEKNRYNIISATETRPCLWNKLIKRDLYNLCSRIPAGLNYGEDKCIAIQLYFHANKIAKVNKPLYHYVKYNMGSITTKDRNRKYFKNALQYWNFLSDFFQKQDTKYIEKLDLEKIKHKASLMISTNSYSLRKEYAKMFYEEETIYFSQLKHGKWIIIFLIRHHLFVLAQIYHYGVVLFNRFSN